MKLVFFFDKFFWVKILRNFFIILIFIFLSFNFLFDFTYINKQINNNLSEIVGLDKNNSYVVASMKDESLYFFEYDYNDEKITTPNKVKNGNAENIKIERVHIGERIRDMIYYNEKLYLYLEDTASIAEVSLN